MPSNSSSRAPVPNGGEVTGVNGTGACICAVARKGDIVYAMQNISTLANEAANFESTVSVSGQIQQTSNSNLSANQYWPFLGAQS